MPANSDNDREPPSIAIDEPGKFEEEGYFQGQGSPTPVIVSATFPFQILYRFNSAYKYNDLPRGEIEAKLLELRTILRQASACELENVLPETLKTTSSVAIAQQEQKDWLLVCKFTVTCELQCEASDILIEAGRFAADNTGNLLPPPPSGGGYPSAATLMADHLAAPDPHPQYTTAAELAAAVGSLSYQHNQPTLSNAWTINHGLGKKPSITVVYAGISVQGTIIHSSDDVAVVTFARPIDGTAYCI